MKRFAVASLAVLTLSATGLAACGGGEKVAELEGQVKALTEKNTELEAKNAELTKELEALKGGAEATPEATAQATPKAAKTAAAVKKTPTPPPPTPTPKAATPTPVPSIRPELKTKLKLK